MQRGVVSRHPDFGEPVHRPRRDVCLSQLVVLAAVAENVLRECQLQHLHEFEELRHSILERLAETLELVGLISTTYAQYETPMRQGIHHADLGDEPNRLVERGDHHRRSELDAASLAG